MERFICRIRGLLLIVACLSGIAALDFKVAAGQTKETAGTELAKQKQDEAAGQESFKIKVAVDLVTTDVTVIGKPTRPLGPEDFVIYDNNVIQPVSHFSRDQIPLAVAILVDASLSIDPYLPVLQVAAASALRRLRPEDQVALYTFSSKITRLCDLTEDRLRLAKKVGEIKTSLGTDLFGCVFDAADYLRKNAPQRRRAMIVISDNCHRLGSFISAKGSRDQLLQTNTTLYDIRTPGLDNSEECNKRDQEVTQLTADTGGEVLDVERPTSLQEVLEKAITNLRMQYTLGFNPSTPGAAGSFHKLAVKLASQDLCPDCRVLSRSGYYSGVALPPPVSEKPRAKVKQSPEKMDELLVQRSIANAAAIVSDLTAIPFSAGAAEEKDAEGNRKLKVDLLISPNRIDFSSVESLHACKLRIAIFYVNSSGKILGSEWRALEGNLSEETYSKVQRTGIPFSVTIPAKGRNQWLKIVVYDERSDKVGTRFIQPQLLPQ
jgi:VWFA-related protein